MPLWTVSLLAMCRMHGRQLLCTWDRKAAQLCAKEPARSTSHLLIKCLIRSHSLFPLYAPGISCQHAVHSTPSSLQTHLLSSGMVFIPWCSATWQHLFYSPNHHLFTIFSIKTFPNSLKPVLLSRFLFGRHVKYMAELHQWLLHDCPSASEW